MDRRPADLFGEDRLMRMAAGFLILLATAGVARAEPLRDLCTDRPGKATPACIVDAGHFQLETGAVDWTRDVSSDERADTVAFAGSELRYGIAEHAELQAEWMPFGISRTRDRASGAVQHLRGTGDLTLGLRRNLANPDGDGLAYAVQPFVTLPTGGKAIGAGTWGAGVLAPVTLKLPGDIQLGFDPEVDAAPNESRSGRHLAYSGVFSVTAPISEAVAVSTEIWGQRDRDPEQHQTETSFDMAATWQPASSKDLQFDVGANLGLNHATPDVELYAGVVRRF
jgi:hypothetical protein